MPSGTYIVVPFFSNQEIANTLIEFKILSPTYTSKFGKKAGNVGFSPA